MFYYILGIITGLLIALARKENIVQLKENVEKVVKKSDKAQFIDPISDEEKVIRTFNE